MAIYCAVIGCLTAVFPSFFGAFSQVNKERYVSKMFLRGDSVIIVVKNPNPM